MPEINNRQILFINGLLEGKTYTQAYKDAGYKPKNDDIAASKASRLLTIPKVQAYWEQKKQELFDLSRSRMISLALDALPVLQELMLNAKTEAVKLGAARDILDRAGLKPEMKLEIDTPGRVFINFVGLGDDPFPDAEE